MRFFRIPGFTGIEAHRDDADRGSLRIVEGCLPHGPGGLRSGPVWKKVGEVSSFSTNNVNQVSANDDGQGNSLVLVSRNCEIRDMVLISSENTDITSFGKSYDVALPEGSLYSLDNATISSVGNRLYAVGDGSQEAMYIGKGPTQADSFEVYPDETLYKQEWSRFPKCKYYARGPKGSLFASGNPDKPLTVYISEPPGLTASIKDSPYSTEDSVYNTGRLSTVEILGSDASKITALSTRGDQVVVHTDKGSYLLYAPSGDQASTGYRVEQAPATNFSAAINQQVVSGESGTQTFWVGHDGQIYKDEAASRGSADLRSKADEDQANWKSKGVWEHERPVDLSNSFATFEAQTGNYVFYLEEKKYDSAYAPPTKPLSLTSSTSVEFNTHWKMSEGDWVGITDEECFASQKQCYVRTNENLSSVVYRTEDELPDSEKRCCVDAGVMDCCWFPDALYVLSDCECVGTSDVTDPNVSYYATIEECIAEKENDIECQNYSLTDCNCTPDASGIYNKLSECETVKDLECHNYSLTDCNCTPDANGIYSTLSECETAKDIECQNYSLTDDCYCTPDDGGIYNTLSECRAARAPECDNYNLTENCQCVKEPNGQYSTITDCETARDIKCSPHTFNDCCGCEPSEFGEFETYFKCLESTEEGGANYNCTPAVYYDMDSNGCCQPSSDCPGTYSGLEACLAAGGTENINVTYCLTTGGYASYDECNATATPLDYLRDCVSDNPEDPDHCDNCPNLVYVLSESGCGCEAAFDDEIDIVMGNIPSYSTIEECSLNVDYSCAEFNLNGCICEIVPEGTGTYTGIDACNAARDADPSCGGGGGGGGCDDTYYGYSMYETSGQVYCYDMGYSDSSVQVTQCTCQANNAIFEQ